MIFQSIDIPTTESVTHLRARHAAGDRKSTRLNSSHANTSYAVCCVKKNIDHHWSYFQHLRVVGVEDPLGSKPADGREVNLVRAGITAGGVVTVVKEPIRGRRGGQQI